MIFVFLFWLSDKGKLRIGIQHATILQAIAWAFALSPLESVGADGALIVRGDVRAGKGKINEEELDGRMSRLGQAVNQAFCEIPNYSRVRYIKTMQFQNFARSEWFDLDCSVSKHTCAAKLLFQWVIFSQRPERINRRTEQVAMIASQAPISQKPLRPRGCGFSSFLFPAV